VRNLNSILLNPGALFYGDGHLLYDFEAEAFQRWDVHGGVRQQADPLNAKVGEDLAAEADGAEDAAGTGLRALARAELLVQEEAVGGCRCDAVRKGCAARIECGGDGRMLVDLKAARGVVQVEDGSATLFGDHAHGVVEDFAAVAVGGEDIARRTTRVHPNKNGVRTRRPSGARITGHIGRSLVAGGAAGAEVAADKGDVALAAVNLALVGDHAELAVLGLNAGFAGADNVALVAEAVADEFGDGKNAQAVLGTERDEVGDAGHFAVVAHDFADHPGGLEAGESREVDGRLGLAGADQDASLAGAEGKDVARTDEIVGGGAGRDGSADGVSTVGSGDAGSDALAGFNGLSEGGAEA